MRMTAGEFVSAKYKSVEVALCLAAGLDNIETYYSEQDLHAAAAEYRFGISLREALVMAAHDNGFRGTAHHEIGTMFTHAFGSQAVLASGFSNVNLPGVLSNVANKFLNQGFMAVESGFRQVASKRSVSDFKQTSSYSLTGDLKYELVGPTGEIKSGTMGEKTYTNQAQTYGKLLTVSRSDWLNDDLSAFSTAPRRLGRGAALNLNALVWTAFLGATGTLFTSGHGNLITGGGSALSVTSLGTAQASFRKQTDPDGNPLGIVPKFLLIPPELEVTADSLMHSLSYNTGGASTETQVPNANVFAGKYTVVPVSYLSNSNLTGYSTSAWYLLADPADMSVVEVAYLNGRESPTIEMGKADFASLGMSFRSYHDVGIATQEYRAGFRSDGA